MIDIHNHLAFGVDDGSKSLDETMDMIRQMIESGYRGAIITSHYDKSRYMVEGDMVKAKLVEIEQELEKNHIVFSLYPGNEVQIDEQTIYHLNQKTINTLNGSRYVLAELPMLTTPHYAKGIFYEMQLNGYIPIIAHPERYLYVQKNRDFLLDFIKAGCLIQLNLSSLVDENSAVSKELLDRHMVHFVGTDAHSSTWRNPLVTEELNLLKDLVGHERFERLTAINPKKVIENKSISSDFQSVILNEDRKHEKQRKKKRWYHFWR